LIEVPEATVAVASLPHSLLTSCLYTAIPSSSYLCLHFYTMTTKGLTRSFLPVLSIFLIASGLFLGNPPIFSRWNVDVNVLLIGNLILFVATILSFFLFTRSLYSKNPHAIVRTMYSGVLVKMMLCLVAVFIYISIAGKSVNKGGVFGCMFLYLIYTFTEVAILMKLSKQKKNV